MYIIKKIFCNKTKGWVHIVTYHSHHRQDQYNHSAYFEKIQENRFEDRT